MQQILAEGLAEHKSGIHSFRIRAAFTMAWMGLPWQVAGGIQGPLSFTLDEPIFYFLQKSVYQGTQTGCL